MRRVVRYLVPMTTVLVATTALLPCPLDAAPATQTPLYSLTALLSVTPDLSGAARGALIAEAERIWRREGVKLTWPTASVDESAPLRILVITRREAAKGGNERWAVGELVPQTGQRALAIASIAAAERVLAEADARRLQLLESRESGDYRLGLVLGRAVAHEIGHYLLGTATHADRGLMRASIDAREFADPGARTFTLDEAAGDWLRNRLTQTTDGSLPFSGFSYTVTQEPSVPRP